MYSALESAISLARMNATDVSALSNVHHPRHRWYFFKEAFAPDIVDAALADKGCKKGDLVVDPFSGSGTTVLASAAHGIEAAGREVNPFLRFVAESKLVSPRISELARVADCARVGAERGYHSNLETFSTFGRRAKAAKERGRWLFNTDVLRGFEGGWRSLQGSRSAASQLVKLSLVNAAMDVANAAKDGKCLRFKPNWIADGYDKEDFLEAFDNRLDEIEEDLEISQINPGLARIALGDSRRNKFSKPFKLCVTSPPYLNSFDYTDVYRPELFLTKSVTDMDALRKLRLRTVRSHVQVDWEKPTQSVFGVVYEQVAEQIADVREKLWDKRIPEMIQAYFEDMSSVIANLKDAAADDASVWLIVSTSAYGGVEIPVDLILADIAVNLGWHLREVSVLRYLRRLSSHQWSQLDKGRGKDGPYLRESLVILDRAIPKRSKRTSN